MQKQQILDKILADNTDQEIIAELMALVDPYPEELDAQMVEELAAEVDKYTANSAVFENEYAGLESIIDDFLDDAGQLAEDSLQRQARDVHRNLTAVQDLLN